MIGPHDLGGRGGFGPVVAEPDEPVFHGDWEARVLGITLCSGALGHWSLDESRHARESLPPADYLSMSYYAIWLAALIDLLDTHGEVGGHELTAGRALRPGRKPDRKLPAANVPAVLAKGGPVAREADRAPKFAPGDKVEMRRDRVTGHTRLPAYVMGRVGTVCAVRGHHVYPDSHAHSGGEAPQWLYSVAFDGVELWGRGAEAGTEVLIDAFEPYLIGA